MATNCLSKPKNITMQKLKLKYVFIFFIAFACNDDNEFSSENLNNVLSN